METNIKIHKETGTNNIVIEVLKKSTFREVLIASKIVTEGKTTDWGHSIVREGLYKFDAIGRLGTLTQVFKSI